MAWDDTRAEVLAALASWLGPHGYKLIKSRDAFEKSSRTERRSVYPMLVASRYGTYTLDVWCGVRNNAIEDWFHRTSGVEKKFRSRYTTINRASEQRWPLDTATDVAAAIGKAERFTRETALPFLEREYTYQDYSDLLNADPTEPDCPYHGNRENRCHYGLIAAKLAGDPRYPELKEAYAHYLRTTNNGFHYPRFEAMVADLESSDRR